MPNSVILTIIYILPHQSSPSLFKIIKMVETKYGLACCSSHFGDSVTVFKSLNNSYELYVMTVAVKAAKVLKISSSAIMYQINV